MGKGRWAMGVARAVVGLGAEGVSRLAFPDCFGAYTWYWLGPCPL